MANQDLKNENENDNNLIKCSLNLKYTEISTYSNQYIYIPCELTNDTDTNKYDVMGSNLYKCREDGQFYLVNTTCVYELKQKWLYDLNKQLRTDENSLPLLEKLNRDLLNDHNDSLLEDNTINGVVNFISNASEMFFLNTTETLTISNVSDVIMIILNYH